MPLHIQPRDREIFKFIYEYGFVTANQIQKAIFPDNNPVTCRVRLSELVHHEYLKRFPYDLTCYKLTRKGIGEIRDIPVDADKYLKLRFPRFYLNHDMGLIDYSLILRKSPLISYWMPRSELGQYRYECGYILNEGYRVPDAIFDIKANDQTISRVALEYELSQKSRRRYRSIFDTYFFEKKIHFVLYLVSTEHLKMKLLEILNSMNYQEKIVPLAHQKKVFIATINDFLKERLHTKFQGPGERSFSLVNFEVIKPPALSPNTPENKSLGTAGVYGLSH